MSGSCAHMDWERRRDAAAPEREPTRVSRRYPVNPEGRSMLGTVLLVFAFVFACIASCVPGPIWGRIHFGWLALAFYIASLLFGQLGHLVR